MSTNSVEGNDINNINDQQQLNCHSDDETHLKHTYVSFVGNMELSYDAIRFFEAFVRSKLRKKH